MFTACLSNSIESLYAALRRDYQQKCVPFQKRIIAVPHVAFISYLQRRLAEDSQDRIFFGATIGLLENYEEADELFLFGFSACDEATFLALKDRGARGYFLSPTMMYWEDLVSDHKAEFILEKAAPKIEGRLRELLFDRHPLLANLGARGRAFFTLLQESGIEIEECYEEREPITLLQSLQHDLLHLEEKVAEKDNTLVMHAALTPLQEVELLFDALSAFAENKILGVGDLVVQVENLERYRPHIERVFGSTKSPFSYQILARSNRQLGDSVIGAFLHLLQLVNKRGAKEQILELLDSAAFCRRWKIEEEERAGVKQLLLQQKSDFLSARDREQLLQLDGLQVILQNEISIQESFVKAFATTSIDSSTASAAASFLKAVELLAKDLRSIATKEAFSRAEWSDLLHTLLSRYFECFSSDAAELEVLYGAIEEMAKEEGEEFSAFNELLNRLHTITEKHFLKREGFQRCELLFMPMGRLPFPARFFALLNANEIKDSYTLVEAVLSVKEALFLSYQSYSFEERSKIALTGALRELAKVATVKTHRLRPMIKKQKREPAPFSVGRHEIEPQIVDLALLRDACRSPLKLYFQKALSLKLPREAEEEFSALDIHLIKKSALEADREEFLASIEAHHKLPKSSLKGAYMSHFEALYQEQQAIAPKVEVLESSIGKGSALQVGKFLLTGTLEAVQGNTLIHFGRDSREQQYRKWADILFLAAHHGSVDLFSIADNKSRKIEITKPLEKLERYIEYALTCCKRPFLIFPEQIHDLLHDKCPSAVIEDPYHTLFMQRHQEADSIALLEESRAVAKELFLDGGNDG